jgi:hypothetical protein
MDATTEGTAKPAFEHAYPEIKRIVETRRGSWTYTSLMEWTDVSAIIVERAWRKWDTFEPAKGPLENWLNRLISHALINLRRDLLLRWSRPCIGGWNARGKTCFHNLGGETCAITKSHKQCAECPIYADWQKAREHQLHIKSTVALEHHAQEAHNIQGDFTDAAEIKDKLDAAMKEELTPGEWRVWYCLYVKHMKPSEASTHLEALVKTWKRLPRPDEIYGYQSILQTSRRLKEIAMEWLRREDHI